MTIITSSTLRRARSSFTAGLVALLVGPLGGCVIEAKIGDDPEGDSDTGDTDSATSDGGTGSPGNTSGAEPGTASATTTGANPGSASFTTAGEDSATAEEDSGNPGPGVDEDTALALCGVIVMPPEPGDPVYEDGIMCADGCLIFVESTEPTNLLEQGDCVCEAMGCGPLTGGTSGGPGGSTSDTDGGDPDGCGPFPPGEAGFTCVCEMCSIDVTNVDAGWVEGEADLATICECMCGGAGCGSPV